MAIYVNGKKVAGIGANGKDGVNGKSAYQAATDGGYSGTEQEFNQALGNLNQLFTSVSDGKSAIAAAITDKGVTTAADATFQQMADNIMNIESGNVGELCTLTIIGLNNAETATKTVSGYNADGIFNVISQSTSSGTYQIPKNALYLFAFSGSSGTISFTGSVSSLFNNGGGTAIANVTGDITATFNNRDR